MANPFFVLYIALLVISTASSLHKASKKRSRRKEPGILVNERSLEYDLPLLYGPSRVGGNIVYRTSTGDGNEYYHMILAFGEGPGGGIMRQDGTVWSTPATEIPSTNPALIYIDGELWAATSKYSNCYFEWFAGTADQNVCATLNAASPEFTDPMRYTQYLYCRFLYDRNKFESWPTVTLVPAGLQCYDPTAETTASTTNFALMAYDILTRPSSRGGLELDDWHAAPPADARIDIDSLEAARSYCESKNWKGGIPITKNNDVVDNLDDILNCFRGDVIYSENVFKFRYRDLNYESVAMDLTEDDVILNNKATTMNIKTAATTFDRPNALRAVFYNAALNYVRDEFVYEDGDAIAADGDYREKRINLYGLNTPEQLQAMCSYFLERFRWGHTGAMQCLQRVIKLEPMDLIRLTHSRTGYDQQYLRVTGVGINMDHTISLKFVEEDTRLYNDSYDVSDIQRHVPTLFDPSAPPPSVYGGSITEIVSPVRLRSSTALLVTFTVPPSYERWWRGVKVYKKIGMAGDWDYMTEVVTDYIIAPVEEGVEYYVRLVSVNVNGVQEDFDGAYTLSRYVTGKLQDIPADVTGMTAIATGDSVAIRAGNPNPDDVVGWEVRLGDAWDGGIFLTLLSDPSYGINGVRPGTHTFWMAMKTNAGIYSANPVSAVCKVLIPGWLTSAHSWSWDFTTGTHNNTEHDTYSSQDVLKCSHTGGVLDGDWTSPSYDMGSLKTVRVWGDFLSVFFASSSTWGGVVPSPDIWDDLEVDTRRWSQIFAPTEAAQLRATLEHSENGSDWTALSGFELLFAEVYARYLRVKVYITDPNADANLYLYALNMSAYTGPV